MSREYYLITKMRHPNVVGLVELSRRTGSTVELIKDIFGLDRIVRIDATSVLHEICNRTLENRSMFFKYRFIIKGAIVNAVNKHARTQIFRMNKHACYKIVIEEVIVFVLNKYMLNGRRAITRRENRAQFRMASEVLRYRSNRLKNSSMHLCSNFESDLLTSANETIYVIKKK